MSTFEITAVRLSSPQPFARHITHVKSGNETWTVKEVVGAIRLGYAFTAKGKRVEVVNAQPPYIRSDPDNAMYNNLLSLPRF